MSTVLTPWLRRWDQRAAAGCACYVTSSHAVAGRIERVYGREALVVPPPSSFDPDGPQEPIAGARDGFVVAASRLLGYKNIAAVVEAFRQLPDLSLLVVGGGPLQAELQRAAPANVTIAGEVSDDQLRWAYAHSLGLVSAANEDFGLTPVEAARFGKPSALLRAGGFLDTGIEGINGVFFDTPTPGDIAAAVRTLVDTTWDDAAIQRSAQRFSEANFSERLQVIVSEVAQAGR